MNRWKAVPFEMQRKTITLLGYKDLLISFVLYYAFKIVDEEIHNFYHLQDECSFVSLRDVDRALNVMSWFYAQSQEEHTLFANIDRFVDVDEMFDEDEENSEEEEVEEIIVSI